MLVKTRRRTQLFGAFKNLPKNIVNACLICLVAVSLGLSTQLLADEVIAFAKPRSSVRYYQLTEELIQALVANNASIEIKAEDSESFVASVKHSADRLDNFVFPAPRWLVRMARKGEFVFKGDDPATYRDLRLLFVLPPLAVHMVVRADADINKFGDLASHKIMVLPNDFAGNQFQKHLNTFGMSEQVEVRKGSLNEAVAALADGAIHGFVTSEFLPGAVIQKVMNTLPVKLLGFTYEEIEKINMYAQRVPPGTYRGIETETVTTSHPAGVYTTISMNDNAAYELTKNFWVQKQLLSDLNQRWNSATFESLLDLGTRLHPGALKFYREAGADIPKKMR